MITPIETPWEDGLWRALARQAYRHPRPLLEDLGLAEHQACVDTPFAMLVPRGFAGKIRPGDPYDPILKQVLPVASELRTAPGFSSDPLEEGAAVREPALIQKYQGRALLITTSGCAVHCRYCFRRNFPYADHRPKTYDAALQSIAADKSIREVILSGGDPLLLDDPALAVLLESLGSIVHLRTIRLHTRLPVVLPERVSASLLACLAKLPMPCVVVVHVNHAQELCGLTKRAFAALRKHAWLLNQSVLLHGINDAAHTQIELAQALFEQGVLPYYLHLPDRVTGTAHFQVGDDQARQIHRTMRAALPGYLVPRLVREVPGAPGKVLL